MTENDDTTALIGVLERNANAARSEDVLGAGLDDVLHLARARTAVVLAPSAEGPVVAHVAGVAVPAYELDATSEDSAQVVPESWRALGIGSVRAYRLPGVLGQLVVGWAEAAPCPAASFAGAIGSILDVLRRIEAETVLADLSLRVDSAQLLAGMGDYDWHIATDTNRWSDQLYRIYGYEPQSFNASYERFMSNIYPEDRERIQGIHQEAYATGEPYSMIERIVRPDGELRYLSSNGEVIMDADRVPIRMRGTCIDITELVLAERERELVAERLGESRQRRRQAFEINDSLVQGLTSTAFALDQGDPEAARNYLDKTLVAARSMMDSLLEPSGPDLVAGDLVRAEAATLEEPVVSEESVAPASEPADLTVVEPPPTRVLIVDDAEDIRMLLRLQLGKVGKFEIVGEAGDGLAAVELARDLQPDLVLLDMAMPRMDGLQALPLIREAVPGVRVIVLSGFNQETLEREALAAGAARYVTKGGRARELLEVIDSVLSAA